MAGVTGDPQSTMADIEKIAESVDSLKVEFEGHRYICSYCEREIIDLARQIRR